MLTELPSYWLLGCLVCQLLFVSGWVSRSWTQSRITLITRYPPETFPRLYACSEAEELKRVQIRAWCDRFVLVVGLVVVGVLGVLDVPKTWIGNAMLIVAVCQWLPILLSYHWCQKSRHLRAEKYPTRVRRATIGRASLFTLASASKWWLLGASFICANGMAIAFIIKPVNGFSSVQLGLLIGLSSIMVAYLLNKIRLSVKGPRADHFIANEERKFKQQNQISSVLVSLILYHFFFIGLLLTRFHHYDPLLINLLSSLLIQYLAWTVRKQYLPIDPTVYRGT